MRRLTYIRSRDLAARLVHKILDSKLNARKHCKAYNINWQ